MCVCKCFPIFQFCNLRINSQRLESFAYFFSQWHFLTAMQAFLKCLGSNSEPVCIFQHYNWSKRSVRLESFAYYFPLVVYPHYVAYHTGCFKVFELNSGPHAAQLSYSSINPVGHWHILAGWRLYSWWCIKKQWWKPTLGKVFWGKVISNLNFARWTGVHHAENETWRGDLLAEGQHHTEEVWWKDISFEMDKASFSWGLFGKE